MANDTQAQDTQAQDTQARTTQAKSILVVEDDPDIAS